MAAKKEKILICRECGHMTPEKKCPNCGSDQFIDKYKGKAVIFDVEKSHVAEKIEAKKEGAYALKYG